MAKSDFQRLLEEKKRKEEPQKKSRPKGVLFVEDQEEVPADLLVEQDEIVPTELLAEDDLQEEVPVDLLAENDTEFDPEAEIKGITREVPYGVAVEVGGLTKPEDRLAVLRKYYPDARSVGEYNAVMTDPTSGEQMVLNRKSWNPLTWGGDIARNVPEVAGFAGGIAGGTGGAAVSAPSGPGAIAGAAAGAGLGYAGAKGLAANAINDYFGNGDTRSTSEFLKDAAIDAAAGAVGEGVGRVAQIGVRAVAPKLTAMGGRALEDLRYRAGYGAADDPIAARQAYETFDAVGAQPTPGMIAGGERGLAEAVDARTAGSAAQRGVQRVEDQISAYRDSTYDAVSQNAGMSRGETGQLIRESVEANRNALRQGSNQAYREVDELVGKNPVDGVATHKWLTDKKAAFDNLGENAKLNSGSIYNSALEQGRTLVKDLEKGASFNQIKEARTAINDIAWSTTNKTEASLMKELAESLTRDMEATAQAAGEQTLKKWQAANKQYRGMLQRQGDESLRAMDGVLNRESSESIYDLIANGTRKNYEQANRILQQVRQGGGDQAGRDVIRSVMDRVGVDRAGNFSAAKFVKDWDGMSKEGRSFLAHHSNGSSFLQSMNQVADAYRQLSRYTDQKGQFTESIARRTGKAIDRQIDKYSTPALMASAVTGHVAAPAAIAAVKAAKFIFDRAGRRFVDDPELARWLAGVARSPKPEREIGKLRAIAQRTKSEATKAGIRDLIINWERYQSENR